LSTVLRRRLDVEMVRRRLVPSRQQAERLVAEGRVLVDGAVAAKCARLVAPGQAVAVAGPPARFVSRGGEKLDHALARFAMDVAGRTCLDVGASTGGFTDCLLRRHAARVVAVDAGHGQLHPRIRGDERVVSLERTNARSLCQEHPELIGSADVIVADVSFISLTTLVPELVRCARGPGSDIVVLVKPQFEAGRAVVARGAGVVRDADIRLQAVRRVAAALVDVGVEVVGATASPVLGPAGNAEVFVRGVVGTNTTEPTAVRGMDDEAKVARLQALEPMLSAAVGEAPDTAAPDVGAPDTAAPDVGASDTAALDVGVPDARADDAGADVSGARAERAGDPGAPGVGAGDAGALDAGADDAGAGVVGG
jgi:23S rRNA (cytidine1920-2'-O)/16S rRNA (cytidine1409-2'-O)-methyltransferase